MKRLVFRRAARTDLGEARDWYRRQDARLLERFAASIEIALDAICRAPARYPILHEDVRFSLVDRFPYVIYFRDFPEKIQVLAVLHSSRDPEIWRSRT